VTYDHFLITFTSVSIQTAAANTHFGKQNSRLCMHPRSLLPIINFTNNSV